MSRRRRRPVPGGATYRQLEQQLTHVSRARTSLRAALEVADHVHDDRLMIALRELAEWEQLVRIEVTS